MIIMLFGFVARVAKGAVDTALVPLATTADVLSGDLDLPRTGEQVDKVVEDIEDILDPEDE